MAETLRPNPQAQEVFQIFRSHIARADAALRRGSLENIEKTSDMSKQLLGRLPGLIAQSEASEFWKKKLQTTLFDGEGNYNSNNGMGYLEAPGWYFGVYQTPEGLTPGIFDKQDALMLETNRMLFDAYLFQNQVMKYAEQSPTLKASVPQKKKEFREWADSYESHYEVSVVEMVDGLVEYLEERKNPGVDNVRQQVASLKAILGEYTDEA